MAESEHGFANFDLGRVPSPCYVIDIAKLEGNLRVLADLAAAADVRILLALKAFSCLAVADLVRAYLHGTAASGLWESRLGRTHFGGAVHTFAPGLKAGDLAEIEGLSDHLIFNTLSQWERFAPMLARDRCCSYGLRLNPRHSEVATPLYDPCAPWSRLGMPPTRMPPELPDGLTGLHVHALCDQGFEPFDRLLAATERVFAPLLEQSEWINLGGGHLITATDYPVWALADRLSAFRRRTGLETYLEPGTAVALNAGVLIAEVLDTGWNEGHFAILDCSATCHMPDVIEAPYTPEILDATAVVADHESAGRDDTIVRLGGPTCLAGDVIGTYRFPRPPRVGERVAILDQAYYTMVKTTTFNGTPLPSIALWDARTDDLMVVRQFGYDAFESRLG